ncbi:MAG: hypothetical protein J6V25_12010 [Oscillospiraceae bacterium]|nr:hypothetical protein [Oscillospiraceae bacterium]
MRLYPYPQTKFTNLLLMLLMAGLLYVCRDSMYTTAMLGFNKAYVLTLALVAVSGLYFLVYNRRQWKQLLLDPRMLMLLAVTVVMLLPMLVKGDWQMMYFSILVCLWIGIFFSFFWQWQDAAKCYVVLFSAIGVYSMLATYVLRILPDRDILEVPVFYNAIGHMFHHFGFSIVSDEYVRLRNFGIFREPSVYHCFILLALYLNNYSVCWKQQKWLWVNNLILSMAMVSTLATGGFVELAILAVAVFFHKGLHKSRLAWTVILILAVLAGIFLAVVIMQQGEIYWTLYGTFVSKFAPGADSSSDRVNSIVENAAFFFRSPFVGGKIAAVFDTVPNNTSSTTLLFAIFGLGGGLIHLLCWFALVWDKNRSWLSNLVLLAVLFMALNTQNLIANLFIWLLPMMAMCQRGIPWVQGLMKKE